jgi:peptidoglycan/LPS O-acetylase OafA/YrhL
MKQNLTSLQAGRGLAAMAVLLYHVGTIAEAKLGQSYGFGFFCHADHGVDFFFVLSGFIIFYANQRSIGLPNAAPRYFYRRVVRIYPLLVLLTLVKVGYMVLGGPGVPAFKQDLTNILCSLLLIPQTTNPVIAVSWTLWCEMFFYCIFLLVILYGRNLRLWMAAHALVCLVLNFPGGPRVYAPVYFFVNSYNLEFYMGCITAYLCLTRRIPATWGQGLCFGGLTLTLVGLGFHDELSGVTGALITVYWGAGFSLILLGLSALEQQGLLKAPRWLAFTGDASYSIYLIHTSVLELAYVVLARHKSVVAHVGPLIPVSLAVVALFVGIGCYVLVERPILLWLHRKGPQKVPVAPSRMSEPAARSLSNTHPTV